MAVDKKYQSRLEDIKSNVKESYDYFQSNYDRFNEFRRFVFETALSGDDIALLNGLSKPALEFNVLEAYISRLLGEFSKQEPSIEVYSDDQSAADPQTINLVEQHIRHILCDSQNYHTAYEVYKDLLSGGFSVFKVLTEYANSRSLDQVIKWQRVFDPTLCGFDKTARYSHKGDGRYCFELYPMEKQQFKNEFPDVDISQVSFSRGLSGFNWSYLNGVKEILIVGDYYEKKIKRTKILKLSDGKVVTLKKYEEMQATWNDFAQMPVPTGKMRVTDIETICRYRLIENKVLEHTETDFTFFPLIFADGNSIIVKTPKNGNVRQVTRPYVYHAKGAQRLKNFAGISLANEIENIVQHKFMVAKEALPKEEDFLEAYKDIQKANVLVYNQFFEQNPDQVIPNPVREVGRVPAPPEIVQAFTGADSLVQNILGSFDASLGINDNQLSGIAIVEGATQSNAAAMPYIVGYLQGLNRVAEIIIDLIPKYYKTARTIPIMDEEGKKSYVKINQQGGMPLFYDENVLNVKVEAGVNFQVQKSRALQQIIALMNSSPLFAQFVNEKGLSVLLDNIEIRGIDQIKVMAQQWMQELQKQKEAAMQAQQQAQQNNPAVMKAQNERMKIQMDAKQSESDFMLDVQRLKQDEEKILSNIQLSKDQSKVQLIKALTEKFAKEVDLKIKHQDQMHRHAKESVELHHHINQPQKESTHAAK